MTFEVTLRRMTGERLNLLHTCSDVETAIDLTRTRYPGCRIVNVRLTDD